MKAEDAKKAENGTDNAYTQTHSHIITICQ